jgi:hypothetical protein
MLYVLNRNGNCRIIAGKSDIKSVYNRILDEQIMLLETSEYQKQLQLKREINRIYASSVDLTQCCHELINRGFLSFKSDKHINANENLREFNLNSDVWDEKLNESIKFFYQLLKDQNHLIKIEG